MLKQTIFKLLSCDCSKSKLPQSVQHNILLYNKVKEKYHHQQSVFTYKIFSVC